MTDRRPRSPMRDRNRDRQEQPRGPGYDHRGGFRRDNNRRPDEPPRRDDRRNDRDYRRRSRSPRRDRREDKYAKDKDNFGLPDRGAPRAPTGPRDGGRRDRDRSRSPRRERDPKKDDRRRSRSPRRDRERDSKRDSRRDRDTRSRSPRRDRDRLPEPQKEEKVADQVRLPVKEDELTSSRVATPPVSFKVGGTIRNERPTSSGSGSGKFGQDHDRMEVDKPVKKSGSSRKEKVEESDDDVDIVVEDDGLAAMQAMMGFGGFGTTHQKKVAGNDISAVRKEKKTEYRQYMNRVGGFNRPLDEM